MSPRNNDVGNNGCGGIGCNGKKARVTLEVIKRWLENLEDNLTSFDHSIAIPQKNTSWCPGLMTGAETQDLSESIVNVQFLHVHFLNVEGDMRLISTLMALLRVIDHVVRITCLCTEHWQPTILEHLCFAGYFGRANACICSKH